MSNKRRIAYIAIFLNVLIWSAALPVVKPAYESITPFQFLYFRYLIAAPVMLIPLLYYLKKIKPSLKTLGKIVLLEILGVPIPLSFLYHGLERTTAIEASLLAATAPILITLGGIIFLREKEDKREWTGLGIAIVGTLLLILDPVITGNGGTITFSLFGNSLVLAHNLAWTAYLLLAKKHYKKVPKTLITSISSIVALISFWTLITITNQTPSLTLLSNSKVALAAFYMGILGTPIAYTLYIYGQNLIEASEASLFGYLSGPLAIPFAMILLNESATPVQIISTLIIAFGVIMGEYKPRKTRHTKSPRSSS